MIFLWSVVSVKRNLLKVKREQKERNKVAEYFLNFTTLIPDLKDLWKGENRERNAKCSSVA